MNRYFQALVLMATFAIYSCSSTRRNSPTKDNGQIDLIFVQVNDVYEIAPLEAGKVGGMARVATVKKDNLAKNKNTFLVMAGDFLSPSVYNSLKFENKRIRGRQMVETMNTAGMDLAVFGNHEFDISESELESRINESTFKWVSSNTFHQKGNTASPFVKTTTTGTEPFGETYIMPVKDADGTTARIGFIGLTLPFNKAAYVSYTDPNKAAQILYDRIKDSCDAVIAITHQSMDSDISLARSIPGLALIMGGHEHERHYARIGNVYITKADANARSAYIIKLGINKTERTLKVKTELKMIDETVSADPATDVVVKKWTGIADKNYSSLGFDARKVVMQTGDPLDGREAAIRTKSTNLTRIIIAAMQEASPTADVVITNGGSIRVDDILQMPVTQYDIIRSLPFGGSIIEVDMKGGLLIKILDAGKKNIGIGGFLHFSPELKNDAATNTWTLKNTTVDPQKIYKVALTDFLMTGGEANMDFLKPGNPGIIKVYPVFTALSDPRSDIRLAIIKYLEKQAH